MNSLKELLFVDYLFHGHEFRIATILESDSLLKLEIEDKQSGEEWHGEFSPAYIEELTRKTGNFKRFETFVSMLQTVLVENCDSLSVDLMTYSDLESLRQRKIGNSTLSFGSNRKASNRQNKRYLIMTYTTEFDKIHYPLPLNFQGRMDPTKLKEIVRQLRTENSNLRRGKADYSEIEGLKRRILDLQEENNEIRNKLSSQRNNNESSSENQDLRKELRALKSVVHGLEEELSQERSKHQRVVSRKSKDYQTLNEELEEIKASERNLKIRLRNLTNELAMYKRHKVQGLQPPWSSKTDPIYSRPPRSNSMERIRSSPRTLQSPRNFSKFSDHSGNFSDASDSHKSVRSEPPKLRKSRSMEKSPSSAPRFDPTAYVHQQMLKKHEIQERRKRDIRSRISSSSERGGFRSRDASPASSVRSAGSRESSRSNHRRNQFPTVYNNNHSDRRYHTPRSRGRNSGPVCSDDEWVEEEIQRRRTETFANADGRELNGIFRRPTPLNEPPVELERSSSRGSNRNIRSNNPTKSQRGYSGTYKPSGDAYMNESDEIGEIDRRLNVLQDFFQKYLHVS